MSLKSKHESHESRPKKGGAAERHEGGFAEGEYGRGPTPYSKSHSAKPGTFAQHKGTSGRGSGGIFGGADQNKGHAADIEHPADHCDFEELGR